MNSLNLNPLTSLGLVSLALILAAVSSLPTWLRSGPTVVPSSPSLWQVLHWSLA